VTAGVPLRAGDEEREAEEVERELGAASDEVVRVSTPCAASKLDELESIARTGGRAYFSEPTHAAFVRRLCVGNDPRAAPHDPQVSIAYAVWGALRSGADLICGWAVLGSNQ
jgi:hypothetical protein